MHLTLSPVRGLPGQPETTLHVAGDVLSIDGMPYDLSAVPEGGEGEWPDTPIIGRIMRQGGILHATVRVVLDEGTASDQPCAPSHWIIPDASGAVRIPAIRISQEDLE